MRSRRPWWIAFVACSAAVLGALAWITVETVRLERAEGVARARAERQEAIRLALWRMDAWFAPLLAREGARQFADYQSFSSPQAFTKMLRPLEQGEIIAPSPLLTFRSQYIRVHFQAVNGRLTSPAVPEGNERDLAESGYITGADVAAAEAALEEARIVLAPLDLGATVAAAEIDCCGAAGPPALAPSAAPPAPQRQQQAKDIAEWSKRQQAYVQNLVVEDGAERALTVGPLVPHWGGADAAGEPRLFFLRRANVRGTEVVQGFLCDWPRVRAALVEQVVDLVPEAAIVPMANGIADLAPDPVNALATIPAALADPAPPAPRTAFLSPTRLTLAVTWLAVIAALGATALTLRASVLFGESRSRFASAVTHELRTPLTTFRLYSDMLASGMVTSEEQRGVYLRTLRDESDRLARLVENVLAYSRLERRAERGSGERLSLGRLLDRIAPQLRPPLEGAGMELAIDAGATPDAEVETDVEAIGQIVFNLVDNACKYARDAEDRTVRVSAAASNGRFELRVRDGGPGVPEEHVRSIFAPFDRGARGPGDATPGIGLGLALARGLARRMGGELALVAPDDGRGACFRLSLPRRMHRRS
jgi:signal transduction histidine kinase